MKIFIDTNVIIDVIAQREPFFADSQEVFALCESGKFEGVISALTLCTAAYVLRKSVSIGEMKTKLRFLRDVVTIQDVSTSILDKAIDSPIVDFEDAVQFYTATYSDTEYIITRNVKDFPKDQIPALTPTAFLTLLLSK